ncbi:PREDICTED: adhesive plaque matrix protein 2-like [Priapulus caudatus]|uniref:Adhesive plaque matrix protein 2-like n=1 Tax=Priapulus caudatus TaxID=37621 RepID=A0ABM1EC75_PRICU|nr:PREDICTED: adhesive plaque matrix protein 2-like [Priapulus caudatus]
MKILVILLLVGATYADDSVFSRIRDGGYGRRYDHRPVIRHDVIRDDCYPNPCRNHGVCLTSSSSGWDRSWGSVNYYCKCPRGYSGRQCEHYESQDYCYPNPCLNGGVCLTSSSNGWDRSWGSVDYYCKCPHGYSGKRCGQYQPPQDYCYPNPCLNHGVCLTSSSNGWDRSWGSVDYYCKCPRDYSGTRCERYESSNPVSDYCHRNNPCRNGGVCLTSSSRDWDPRWGAIDFYCRCPTGYSGTRCERDESSNSDYCYSNPCRNGGVCLTSSSHGWDRSWGSVNFYCKCPRDYSGTRCERYESSNPDYCHPNPCRNGGVCLTSSSNGWDRSWGSVNFYCKCPRDYSGRHCEHYESQDYVSISKPCRNVEYV